MKGAEAVLCVVSQEPGVYFSIAGKWDRKISYSLQHSEQHQGHHERTQGRTRADECQLG